MAAASSTVLRSFRQIPGPPSYPIVGTLLQYTRWGPYDKFRYHLALESMYRQYGPVVREKIGWSKTIVHVFEPEDIKTVYSHEGKWPVVPPLQETTEMYRRQKKMSLGLGNTNGEEWYRLRSNSQQKLLRPREVQHHLPSVNQIAREFTDRLARIRYINNEVNDLKTEMGKWSLENAGKLIFERRLGCLDDETEEWGRQMVEANKDIFRLSGILKLSLPIYKFISTPKWKRLVSSEDKFYNDALQLVDDAVLRMRDAVENKTMGEGQFYVLSYLMSKSELSMKDVAIVCLSVFSDGLSTTTPTMLFNLYCLATNPEVQAKVYDEVVRVAGKNHSDMITQEHINKMPYMKAFIKETFRLFPNGTEISRFTEEPMVLSGYNIPKGTYVDLNPSVHYRDPELFVDPERHRPERWLRSALDEEEEASKLHPYLLTPFGHGTRMCAGRRLAEQDMHVVLATILRRFRLEYPVGETMEQMYNTLLFPDRPLRVRFLERQDLDTEEIE